MKASLFSLGSRPGRNQGTRLQGFELVNPATRR